MAQNTSEVRIDMVEALSNAINKKDEAKVQALLDAKAGVAEINYRNQKDQTALHQAIWELAPISIIKILVAAKANLNQLDHNHGQSPLHYAMWKEVGVTELLLEAKANPNTLDIHKRTPLQLLCADFSTMSSSGGERQYKIVQQLLQSGADPWALHGDNTPLELLKITPRDTVEKREYAAQIRQLLLESMDTALDIAANKAFNRPRIIAAMTGEHPRAGARSLHSQEAKRNAIYDKQV